MYGAAFPHGLISYGFPGALAIALLVAAVGDLRQRRIANRLNAAIAFGAPLFWWVSGLTLAAMGWQVALALGCLMVSAGLFAGGAMGGGDVKLLTALALWFRPAWFAQMLVVMALAGGVLALVSLAGRRRALTYPPKTAPHLPQPAGQSDAGLPYGIAIALGGLWVLARDYLPLAGASLPATIIGS